MSTRAVCRLGLGALLLAAAFLIPGEVSVWVDPAGGTHLTNQPRPPVPGAARLSPEDLALHWRGRVLGEPLRDSAPGGSEADRFTRSLLAARDDIRRGELRLGLTSLRRLQREHPDRPESAWLLAQVERSRGRLEPARAALVSALSVASPVGEDWRDAAESLLSEIEAELEHARLPGSPEAQVEVHESSHFRVSYDHHFAGRGYGELVLVQLERARAQLWTSLGRVPEDPVEVRVYTRANYLDRYQHRFGFATVGFYDGVIHAVSARHPRDELLALLVHEYAHAIFQQALGGHQPFFLNEGIADRAEERARGRAGPSRGEQRRLLDAARDASWIPLASLVHGFGGLEGKRVRLAYLESRAAVGLLFERDPEGVGRWLARCAAGMQWESALLEVFGLDTEALEAALIQDVRDRFPPDPLAAAAPSQSSGAQ